MRVGPQFAVGLHHQLVLVIDVERFRLDGRVALVTGGSRGLGRVIAEALASAGAVVALTARDGAVAGRAAEEIAAGFGVPTVGIAADVTRAGDVEAAIATALERLGGLHILVNNAGINIRGPIETLTEADWDAVVDTNLKGAWLCCRAVSTLFQRQKWGRVINMTSIVGEMGSFGQTNYAVAKGGLMAFTKTLAREVATKGVTINAVSPGYIETDMTAVVKPEILDTIRKLTPMQRLGTPEEVAACVCFLASPKASFITGEIVKVNGGLYM